MHAQTLHPALLPAQVRHRPARLSLIDGCPVAEGSVTIDGRAYPYRVSYNPSTDSRHLVWLDPPAVPQRAALEAHIARSLLMQAAGATAAGHEHAHAWTLLGRALRRGRPERRAV